MTSRPAFIMLALVSSLFTAAFAKAQDTQTVPEKPELTVRLVPEEPYLQEQIVQTVRVVAAHPFEELVLDLPPVEGADIITMQQPKTRKFSTYGGDGYIYETRRAIFPKASGPLRIPPVRVSGSVAPSRNERESFALKNGPVLLDIKPPPDAFNGPAWLVARRLEIEESWSKPLEELRVGDHVTRTITATVIGATGGHLPTLEHGRSTGLTILPGQVERSTEVTANDIVGRINRSFELRIDSEQPINISPVRLIWWNTDVEAEWRTVAEAVRIEPLPRDVEALVQNLMTEARETHTAGRYGVIAIAAFSVFGLIVALAWLLTARRHSAPEDRVLLRTVRGNPDPIKTVAALLAWGEASFPGTKPMSLEQLGHILGDQTVPAIADLQRAAFGQYANDVDAIKVTKIIIAEARSRRGKSLAEIGKKLIDRLIGPKHHLPNISNEATRF